MCGLILGIFLIVIMISAYIMGAIALGIIVIFIGLLASIGNYKKAKKLKASTMICPNCGSGNVKIQKEISGVSGSGVSTNLWSWDIRSGNHKLDRKRIGVCQDCGFDYPYITQDEVDEAINKARGMRNLWIILAILVTVGGFALYMHSDSKKDAPVPGEGGVAVEETATQARAQDEKPEKEIGYNPISEFDYSLDGEKVILESYSGNSDTVRIKRSYKIDGKKYHTDISGFQVQDSSVRTLVIDKGFETVYTAIFNGCDVQRVYFPKTMTCVYDYTLSYLHPEEGEKIQIYYGGSEKRWDKIFTKYERTKVEDAKSAEEAGSALADKLNEMIGAEYDSSEFEFHFKAKPDDLILD